MTIGEHLEELRRRLIFGLLGFVIAAFVCMIFGKQVVFVFCLPLIKALAHNKLNPQIYVNGVEDTFVVYIKMSLITAAAVSGPWLLYQLWAFVAAGLYPKERKTITRYIPLSVTLLLTGMLFMYFFVLPVTLNFFLSFSVGHPLEFTTVGAPASKTALATPPLTIPVLPEDPPHPLPNQMWINGTKHRLEIFFDNDIQVLPFGAKTLTTPLITLPEYISMVVNLLLAFGLAFQLPLVVLGLARIGIVDIPTLRKWRKPVYFGMAVIAAFIIPDVVTGMLALMIPLIGLYEFGIIMAMWGEKKRKEAELREGLDA
jgi:sec-independent protein translocase protein TatC